MMLWRGAVETEQFGDGESMFMAGHETLKVVAYSIGGVERRGRGRELRELVQHVGGAHAGAGQVVGHLEQHDGVQGQADLVEQGLQGFGLGDGAREAVEQEALAHVVLRQALPDHADDDIVADELAARMSRAHNDANVLCLSADLLSESDIEDIVRVWLAEPFEGGRHQRRVDKIMAIESPQAAQA